MKLPIDIGTKGDGRTAAAQQLLADQGFYNGGIDDDFGPKTEKAVIAFQKKMLTSGSITPETWEALRSTKATTYTVEQIKAVMQQKAMQFFEEEKRINLVAIRMDDIFDNRFSDKLFCIISINGKQKVTEIPWTTMPGTLGQGGVFNPLTVYGVTGSAVMVEGQYTYTFVDDYSGWLSYPYGYQTHPVKYYRDGNRDNRLDRGKTYEGLIGLNLHRMSNNDVEAEQVNSDYVAWSQGCQGASEPHFKKLLNPVRHHLSQYGVTFQYTLLHADMF